MTGQPWIARAETYYLAAVTLAKLSAFDLEDG